jgi:hypothetical protein
MGRKFPAFINSRKKHMKKFVRSASIASVLGALLMAASSANAAIDTTAALAGITDAQTALLAVLGGVLTLGIAVWGTRKVVKFFRG